MKITTDSEDIKDLIENIMFEVYSAALNNSKQIDEMTIGEYIDQEVDNFAENVSEI